MNKPSISLGIVLITFLLFHESLLSGGEYNIREYAIVSIIIIGGIMSMRGRIYYLWKQRSYFLKDTIIALLLILLISILYNTHYDIICDWKICSKLLYYSLDNVIKITLTLMSLYIFLLAIQLPYDSTKEEGNESMDD